MNSARANFAHCVVNNFVYVFGGIESKGEGKESHIPNIAKNITEKYDINSNKWEIIEIENGPPYGAFGWTPIYPENDGKIIILGGTDGDLL
jgi:N-acetylneuraminic acid mutarotase